MPIVKPYYKLYRVFPDPDYFYLENIGSSATYFYIRKDGNPAATSLEYSLDKTNWTTVTETIQIQNIPQGGKIFLRNPHGVLNSDNSNKFAVSTAYNTIYAVGGDIRTLINYQDIDNVTSVPNNCFAYFFDAQSKLKSVENVDFSHITSLGSGSLQCTFRNCNNLTTCLDLSSITNITSNSMKETYSGCSSLNLAIAPNINTWDTGYTNSWLSGVAASGVVMKPSTLTIPTDSTSGVPTGWTTQDY